MTIDIKQLQKKGIPEERQVDQFEDDVIFAVNQLINSILGIEAGDINIFIQSNVIQRRISEDLTILNETVYLTRNPIIEAGVIITIEPGGELFDL